MSKIIKYGFIVLGVIALVGFALKGHIPHKQFDSKKWKNWTNTEKEWSLRWDMMNSLRNNYNLKGMTKEQIIKLLGEPDSITDNAFIYYLGYSKHGINTGVLTLKFENNKVIDYFVLQG